LSSNSSLIGNIIDNGSDTTAAVPARNGVCFQGNIGSNNQAIISGNVILNCATAGIHSKAGTFVGGEASIVANSFSGNAVDCKLDGASGVIKLRGNTYGTVPFTTTSTSDNLISLDTGDIAWATRLNADTTFAVSATLATVAQDSATYTKNCTLAANKITAPVGGLYGLKSQVRIIGVTASGITGASITLVAPGFTRNASVPTTSGQDYIELQLDWDVRCAPGDFYLQLRCFGGSGNVTLDGGTDNHFTGVYLG
jgi:hypothetical protein